MCVQPITIRLAVYSDLESVYRFVCDLEGTKIDFTAFGRIFNMHIRNSDYYYLIAEAPSAPVGFLSLHTQELLHHGGRVGEIQELYIAPAMRRQGVARQLLHYCFCIAKKLDLKCLEVTTNRNRTDAQFFYTACGFNSTHLKFTIGGGKGWVPAPENEISSIKPAPRHLSEDEII